MIPLILACAVAVGVPPVLQLSFDGDPPLLDASGEGQPVEAHGTQLVPDGRFGAALRVAGGYVDGGNNGGVSFCFSRQTIALWVRPARDGVEEGLLATVDGPEVKSWRWALHRDEAGHARFQLYDNSRTDPGPVVELRGSSVLPEGGWTHVAVTIDCRELTRLYVAGQEEATADPRANYAHGRLLLGVGLRVPRFTGDLDEVAIWDRALSPAEVAALASRDTPLPPVAPEAFEGFRVRPLGDQPWVTLRHSDLPGGAWVLRVPEHVYALPGERSAIGTDVTWDQRDGGWDYRWDAPTELKQKVGLDFRGRVVPSRDHVDVELTGTNAGTTVWGSDGIAHLQLFCLKAGGHPRFHDYDAERTFVRRGDRFITMNEVVGGQFASHRMCGVPCSAGGYSSLAIKRSTDGEWVYGLACDRAGSLSFNFQLDVSCSHSNPTWPALEPGRSATVKARLYLLRGSLDELWARYQVWTGAPG